MACSTARATASSAAAARARAASAAARASAALAAAQGSPPASGAGGSSSTWVAAAQARSGAAGAGRLRGAGGRGRSAVIEEKARISPATPLAISPALAASRSAVSGLGSRTAAIALQTGQTQHSALPVDRSSRPSTPIRPATDSPRRPNPSPDV
ncbi:hypothetical protein Aph02nite_20070 [Actinoplanes philippinensis]|uniref:hypothetical protein n=1 Tax=Actinoplanes philippinensis TaxID=35752 RepID=UPI000B82756C|nr:hypothetical protein [Actinoplanes philippinensis]GIE76057.1 hypothetical protein Aph02nite_20070 [Actinoplanes philippinensis]